MALEIRSPQYEQASIQIPEEASRLNRPFNGTLASKKGDEYPIKNNIIDLLPEGVSDLSIAQSTNEWRLTASVYEDLWRRNSLSLLTGEDFPIEKELKLLYDWLQISSGELFIDVGASTALYARAVKKKNTAGPVVALDFSIPMLQQARKKAAQESQDLYLIRADAANMPFYAGCFDGAVCGGTLNELADPLKVLFEVRRVLKADGRVFMMHLLKADTWYKRALQQTTEFSGITFWSLQESNELFGRAGFQVQKQETSGIVCFTKLVPV